MKLKFRLQLIDDWTGEVIAQAESAPVGANSVAVQKVFGEVYHEQAQPFAEDFLKRVIEELVDLGLKIIKWR
ncbi:MAG: hypothetical protein IPO08_22695 [Xanthomonadales bacterium]|nr:hypothetical protein [Xanthomonadales bacterium]